MTASEAHPFVLAIVAGILASGGGFYSAGDLVGDPRAVQRCVAAAELLLCEAEKAALKRPL